MRLSDRLLSHERRLLMRLYGRLVMSVVLLFTSSRTEPVRSSSPPVTRAWPAGTPGRTTSGVPAGWTDGAGGGVGAGAVGAGGGTAGPVAGACAIANEPADSVAVNAALINLRPRPRRRPLPESADAIFT